MTSEFVFDFSDLEPESEPSKLTETEVKSIALAKEVEKYFGALITSATSELEYLKIHSTLRAYSHPQNITWMFDYGTVTLDDIIEDHNSATQIEARSKEVDKLKILKEKLSTVKHKPGFAKVALVRNRNRDGYVESYSALAVFPEGFYVSSGGINSDFHTEQDGREHSIFMTTENACTTHNCDDLYKETPNTSRGVFYLPIKELHESISQLILTNGVAEYSLGRSEQDGTKITQDKENYLLCCLLGGITNETHRIRISDFWRQHSKLA